MHSGQYAVPTRTHLIMVSEWSFSSRISRLGGFMKQIVDIQQYTGKKNPK